MARAEQLLAGGNAKAAADAIMPPSAFPNATHAHLLATHAFRDFGDEDLFLETLHKANAAHATSGTQVYDPGLMNQTVAELSDSGTQTVRPIFVVGMPRSGSTLADQILCAYHAAARRVKTLSLTQVRSEISTSSIDKWRRFEDGLAPFIDVLKRAGRL